MPGKHAAFPQMDWMLEQAVERIAHHIYMKSPLPDSLSLERYRDIFAHEGWSRAFANQLMLYIGRYGKPQEHMCLVSGAFVLQRCRLLGAFYLFIADGVPLSPLGTPGQLPPGEIYRIAGNSTPVYQCTRA